MLHTYNFTAFDSLIALETPFTNRFGITFVYKLPGPIIIQSAFRIASTTPGAGLQFDGLIVINLSLLFYPKLLLVFSISLLQYIH